MTDASPTPRTASAPGASGHPTAVEIGAYVRRAVTGAALIGLEDHLDNCGRCRESLADHVDPVRLDRVWQKIDQAMDEPRSGPAERCLTWLGVPDHVARIVAMTPALRLSWIGAAAVLLLVAATIPHASADPLALWFYLAVSPLVAVAGVGVSFGPHFDPSYEMTAVTPVGRLRLILLRTIAVVALALVLAGLASLVVPAGGATAIAWLLPMLGLTTVSLALGSVMDVERAAAVTVGGWAVLLAATTDFDTGTSFAFERVGQWTFVVVVALAGLTVYGARNHFAKVLAYSAADRPGAFG